MNKYPSGLNTVNASLRHTNADCEATQESVVQREISELHKAVGDLKDAIGILESRLSPVSSPDGIKNAGGEKTCDPADVISPIADRIRVARWNVESLKEAIITIRGRLEI